jgi:OOP family OmpA-OmpF porin
MKRFSMNLLTRFASCAATAGVLFALSPLSASATDGPYAGVEGGANWASPQGQQIGDTTVDHVLFNRGYAAGAVAGYSLPFGLRPELEFSYRRDYPQDAFGTHDNTYAVMANAWYDLKIPGTLFEFVHPYIGAGIGGVRYDTNGFITDRSQATALGYQAGAGVGFDIAKNLTLSVDYRRLWTQRSGFGQAFPIPAEYSDRYRSQTGMATLRYSFAIP